VALVLQIALGIALGFVLIKFPIQSIKVILVIGILFLIVTFFGALYIGLFKELPEWFAFVWLALFLAIGGLLQWLNWRF
jgi:hypothetical protein